MTLTTTYLGCISKILPSQPKTDTQLDGVSETRNQDPTLISHPLPRNQGVFFKGTARMVGSPGFPSKNHQTKGGTLKKDTPPHTVLGGGRASGGQVAETVAPRQARPSPPSTGAKEAP